MNPIVKSLLEFNDAFEIPKLEQPGLGPDELIELRKQFTNSREKEINILQMRSHNNHVEKQKEKQEKEKQEKEKLDMFNWAKEENVRRNKEAKKEEIKQAKIRRNKKKAAAARKRRQNKQAKQ